MLISKRKVIAGYADSSDNEESALRKIPLGQSGSKRANLSSAALPQLPGGSHTLIPAFLFPGSGASTRGLVQPSSQSSSHFRASTCETSGNSRSTSMASAQLSTHVTPASPNQAQSCRSHNHSVLLCTYSL
jgi:hypothetical protein